MKKEWKKSGKKGKRKRWVADGINTYMNKNSLMEKNERKNEKGRVIQNRHVMRDGKWMEQDIIEKRKKGIIENRKNAERKQKENVFNKNEKLIKKFNLRNEWKRKKKRMKQIKRKVNNEKRNFEGQRRKKPKNQL